MIEFGGHSLKQFFMSLEIGRKYNWEECFDTLLTVDNLRNTVDERKELFRISTSTHPDSFEKQRLKPDELYHYVGLTRKAKSCVFIQSGEIKWTNLLTKHEISLKKNEFCKFEAGRYNYEIYNECSFITLFIFEEIPNMLFKRKNMI